MFKSLLGYFADIINYWYVKSCFKQIAEDYNKFSKEITPKLSPLGVLYVEIEFDAHNEEKYHPVILSAKLEKLNEILMMQNLDGLVETESLRLQPYDKEGLMMERYVIKFMSSTRNITWRNTFIIGITLFILFRVIYKYWYKVSTVFDVIYEFIF